MKKIIYAAIFTLAMVATSTTIQAQDKWTQGKKGIYSVGIGGTKVIQFGNSNFFYNRNANIGLSINVSGEYKVWDWIGVGFQTGLDFMWPHYAYYSGGGRYGSIGIPLGVKANVHIMDAANLDIANKLDVYAGLGFGLGPAFTTYNTYSYDIYGNRTAGGRVFGFAYIGPQVGVRYWFDKIAVFAEFGYGATFANVGVTF